MRGEGRVALAAICLSYTEHGTETTGARNSDKVWKAATAGQEEEEEQEARPKRARKPKPSPEVSAKSIKKKGSPKKKGK